MNDLRKDIATQVAHQTYNRVLKHHFDQQRRLEEREMHFKVNFTTLAVGKTPRSGGELEACGHLDVREADQKRVGDPAAADIGNVHFV
jgi:hypothetical protein